MRILFVSVLLAGCLPIATAVAAVITADSSDFEVFPTGPGGSNLGDFGVGDTGGGSPNLGRRALVKFSLAGLNGLTINSATFSLFIIESRKDQFPDPGIITSSPPFVNPGLGDTIVLNIADYGPPDAGDYNSPSIGKDPGVLIAGGASPGARKVTVDVLAALLQAIQSGSPFLTFRIQTATETDGDGLNDLWFFASANNNDSTMRPILEYTSSSSTAPGATPEPSTAWMLGAGLTMATLGLKQKRSR